MTDRPARLLVVSDTLDGGLGASVMSEYAHFVSTGWDVRVLAPDAAALLPAVGLHLDLPDSARRVGAMARAGRVVRKTARSFAPIAVHAHGLRCYTACLAGGVRPYVTIHGSGSPATDPVGYDLLRSAARSLLPRLAVRPWTVSPDIPRPWEFLAHASPRLRLLKQSPIPDDGVPEFLWVGALDHRKHGSVFIRAVTEVARTRAIRGVMVGDGPDLDQLRELAVSIEAPVELIGRADSTPYFERMRALVLISAYEGLAFAVQEAMWVGRPVVVSPLPGLSWMVADGGLYADDVAQTAVALNRLCDPAAARPLGEAAARRIREVLNVNDPWPFVESVFLARAGGSGP